MTGSQDILIRLNKNLNTLREREAKYGGNAPLGLLNQIGDHQTAIALTEKAISGELTETEWREAVEGRLDKCAWSRDGIGVVAVGAGGVYFFKVVW